MLHVRNEAPDTNALSNPTCLNPADTLQRMSLIEEYAILDTPPESAFDGLVRLVAELCGTSMAAISLVCDDRQWFKAHHGLVLTEAPIKNSICARTIDGTGMFTVADASLDPMFRNNPLVHGETAWRFYAGVPIHAHNGVPLGAFCVFDSRPRPEGLSPVQAEALVVLGRQVEAQLELRRARLVDRRQLDRQQQLFHELDHVTNHDRLTDLLNRHAFMRHLKSSLPHLGGNNDRPALLLIEIDNLKTINNNFGHDAGDALLVRAAHRLPAAVPAGAISARIEGAEFAVLLPVCTSHLDAEAAAEAILTALSLPVAHEGRWIECGVNIGIATAVAGAGDAATWLRNAELALKVAKATGRRCSRSFNPAIARAHDRQCAMVEKARSALANGRIVPFYQPQINLSTGKVFGFEALMRIRSATGEVEGPAAIAAAFEDPELALAITDRMVDKVLADLNEFRAQDIDIGHIAINTTSFDFTSGEFGGRLLGKLRAHDLPPSMIEIEICETVLLGRGRELVGRVVSELTEAGVGISLDDFGTGYASLVSTKQLPISALKIDRSFVSDVRNDADNAIIHAIATLGAQLGWSIVAEGIETLQQVDLLRRLGVSHGQGFFFSPAVASDCVAPVVRVAARGRWLSIVAAA